MKKKVIFGVAFLVLAFSCFCKGKPDSSGTGETKVIASTSWTAAFAYIAGADSVEIIAPAALRHPPEYEITPGDIKRITESDVFVYAGFERMMQTLGDSVGNARMVKITCDNSIKTVEESTLIIAKVLGTEKIREERLSEYKKIIQDGAKKIKESGLSDAKLFINKNQIYLAADLGFDVSDTFGPSPVTAGQIATAHSEEYDFIIDNVHNPVAAPLLEVSPASKAVVWRNFPLTVEKNALNTVVKENIQALLEAAQVK